MGTAESPLSGDRRCQKCIFESTKVCNSLDASANETAPCRELFDRAHGAFANFACFGKALADQKTDQALPNRGWAIPNQISYLESIDNRLNADALDRRVIEHYLITYNASVDRHEDTFLYCIEGQHNSTARSKRDRNCR